MRKRGDRSSTILLVILVIVAVAGLTSCGGATEDVVLQSTTESLEVTTPATGHSTHQSTSAHPENLAQGTSEANSAGTALSDQERDEAIRAAQEYILLGLDFTVDQFQWSIEAAAQDNEGGWWVRALATPKDDTSLDPMPIYVKRLAGTEQSVGHDFGTGIDPATEESFPEEVRDQLSPFTDVTPRP